MSKAKTRMNKPIKYIDLFCGIGSFHYSFEKLGFECVMACDINKSARNNYKLNHDVEPLGDICDIDPDDIDPYDILCAGFPCQPFSQAGKQKGFKDKRGTMFSQVMKFVKKNDPKVVILENVRGLLTHDNGKSFKKIIKTLEKEGYSVIHKILLCSDYGIPQMRKRLFIIGSKNIKTSKLNKFFDLSKFEKTTTLKKFFKKKFEKETAYTIRCGGRRSPIDDRHNWDGYWVAGKEYRLTIKDGLKLQGFKKFKLSGTNTEKWKLLGNTIPTIFTHMIGKQIMKYCKF
jgi:DNA (cytosine-5)-methyltransferase 1